MSIAIKEWKAKLGYLIIILEHFDVKSTLEENYMTTTVKIV